MKTSKIFYILNLLLVINSIISCICGSKNDIRVIELEKSIKAIKEKEMKKKKILKYSSIATAVSAAVLMALGLGIYYKKKNAEKIWFDKEKMKKLGELIDDMDKRVPDMKKIDYDELKEEVQEILKDKKYDFNYFEKKEAEKMHKLFSIFKYMLKAQSNK